MPLLRDIRFGENHNSKQACPQEKGPEHRLQPLKNMPIVSCYTTFSLVGVKWYGGHGPVSTSWQPFICMAALWKRF